MDRDLVVSLPTEELRSALEGTDGLPNAGAKATSVIGGMLAGADSIDDLDLLRHGGMPRLFGGVRAPSTLGTFLRSFTHGHVQQLDAVGGRLLAGLTRRAPGLAGGERVVVVRSKGVEGPGMIGRRGRAAEGPGAWIAACSMASSWLS